MLLKKVLRYSLYVGFIVGACVTFMGCVIGVFSLDYAQIAVNGIRVGLVLCVLALCARFIVYSMNKTEEEVCF